MKAFRRFSAVLGVGAALGLSGAACSSDDAAPGTATAGASGSAGAPGVAGNGSSGAPVATAGAPGVSGGGSATAGASTAGSGGVGTAGAAGQTAGAGGSGGAGGAGGSNTTGGLPGAVGSMGCGKDPAQALGMFVNHKEKITASDLVTANWIDREYWVLLPPNYDNKRPYPVVYVGPGCGGKGNNAIPIQKASGNDAIVVGIDYSAKATGRECFMTESFPDPEVNYVQETVANVDAAFCIDKSRRFIHGFSTGSWISYMLGCVEGGPTGLFKGQGHATGNWQDSLPDSACKGPNAYIAAHDKGDGDPYNKFPGGRDHVLKQNGCTMPPVTTPYDPGPMVKPMNGSTIACEQYMGCKAPTVFCTTTGLGHNDQVASGIATYGFWKFWMGLP